MRRPRSSTPPARGRHRKRAGLSLIFLAGIAFPFPAAGQPPPPRPPQRPPLRSPPPIENVVVAQLDRQQIGRSLARQFYYLVDPVAELTIADIRSPAMTDRFRLSESDEINLGFSSSAVWLRIDFETFARESPDWMLTFDYPLLDHIDVYDGAADDDRPFARLGDRLPFTARQVPHRAFALPIPVRGPSHRRLFIRIATESSMQVRPTFTSGREFFLAATREELYFGIAYGLMLLMAVYNLFLFFEVRDPSYLWYVAATLMGVGFLMALYGHAFEYLWPRWPAVANLANPLFASLWIASTAAFARLFLEAHRFSPRVDRVLMGLMVLGCLATAVALFAPYRPAMVLASGSAGVNGITLLICGALAWGRGHRAARFFTLAWLGLGAGVTGLVVSRFGWMPDNALTRNGAIAGSILEMLLLSLALSDKYRLMTVELEGYSRGLETMVADRTQQLEEANSRLRQLSITDPLTGVANRRHFDERLEVEVGRHRRVGAPLSLAMVDIDRFKEFNDRFGHQAGDECLQRVAEAIRSAAHRATDLVARFGGEEFAVLLPETGVGGAREIGERILATVRELRLTPDGAAPDGERIAVSIGLASRIPTEHDPAEEVVAAADRALYEAKRAGRDQLVADLG